MDRCVLLLCLVGVLKAVHGANLLFVFERPGTSHYYDASVIAHILHSRGHNITFLVPKEYSYKINDSKHAEEFSYIFTRKQKDDKEEMNIVQVAQDIQTGWGNFTWDFLSMPGKLVMGLIDVYLKAVPDLMDDVELNDQLMTVNFDLICFEGSFLWFHPFIQRLKIPYVTLTTSSASSLTNSWFHAPNIPAILPAFLMKVHHRLPMPFSWRVLSTVMLVGSTLFFSYPVDLSLQLVAQQYDSKPNITSTNSFGLADIWLTNTDFSVDAPRPFLPNMGLVGGLSVAPAKKLNNEWAKIMDDSSGHGVLLVSMGTVVEGIRQSQVDAMAAAFARLPQTVIWKEVTPPPSQLGKNIIMKPWVPQNDLLGHPNTRAMVYHCGNNGAFEALYHGIPIVGVPVFADQTDVAYRTMSSGMGLVVELPTMTEEKMFEAVTQVINNPKYKRRAEFLSKVYRDNPDSAPERAAHLVEFVLRHNGTDFMKSKVAYQSLYAEYSIDVALVSFLIVYACYKLCMLVLGLLWQISIYKMCARLFVGTGSYYDPNDFRKS